MLNRIRSLSNFYRFHLLHTRSRDAIEQWQLKRLQQLIAHLEGHIPLFRELLAAFDLDAREIRTLQDLERFPVMTKDVFRGRPVDEYIDTSHPPQGEWVTTSGTSGRLFSPLRRSIAKLPRYSDSLRYRFMMKTHRWTPHVDWAKMAHVRVLNLPRKNAITIFIHELLNNPPVALEQLSQFEPDVIEAHASLLPVLAQEAQRLGIRLRPRYIVSASERLTPASRAFVEEEFGCKIFDRYGLEEFGTVGLECEIHDGFHINAESFIVEVVGANGTGLPDGTYGKVLITDLYNDEMPFVRYDSGDRGTLMRDRCACGLESPRLWFEGRYSAFLSLGGQRFHQFEFSEALQTFTPYIFQYQIAKRGENDLAIRIIPAPTFSESVRESLLQTIERMTGLKGTVHIEILSSIPRLPRGKSQIIVDHTA